jgi:hypothetical protein
MRDRHGSGSPADAPVCRRYARVDSWLAQLRDGAAASPPSSPSPAAPPSPMPPPAAAPTPARPPREQQQAPATAGAPAAVRPERAAPTPARQPSASASKPRPPTTAAAPLPPPRSAHSHSERGTGVSKPVARELDFAEPAPGELRNRLVLMLLWVATSVTFSLLVWGTTQPRLLEL